MKSARWAGEIAPVGSGCGVPAGRLELPPLKGEAAKSPILPEGFQYHDGLRILLESDKGLYKAFGQSPRKYLKTENFYLTSKERLTYMMGFIDAFAWLTRQGKLVPDTFPTDIAGFTAPEEPPEERAEYFEQ